MFIESQMLAKMPSQNVTGMRVLLTRDIYSTAVKEYMVKTHNLPSNHGAVSQMVGCVIST